MDASTNRYKHEASKYNIEGSLVGVGNNIILEIMRRMWDMKDIMSIKIFIDRFDTEKILREKSGLLRLLPKYRVEKAQKFKNDNAFEWGIRPAKLYEKCVRLPEAGMRDLPERINQLISFVANGLLCFSSYCVHCCRN